MGDVLKKIMPKGAGPVETTPAIALYSHISSQCHPNATQWRFNVCNMRIAMINNPLLKTDYQISLEGM